MGRYKDISGKRYGRLLVEALTQIRRDAYWWCRCDCGSYVNVRGSFLRNGNTQSCGCLNRERAAERCKDQFTSHGASRVKNHTPEYQSWTAMRRRCLKSGRDDFKNYGGRGITVCKRWMNDFSKFRADMGERPVGTTLDRINNDRGYKPSNCRWATRVQQANNTRKNTK